jgi:ribonuclease P protein subunit POP4
MRITPDVVRLEFIGRHAEITGKNCTSNVTMSGTMIDETRNTFTVLTQGKRKSVIKESGVFRFELSNGLMVEINGELLVGRPENRLKKSIKRLW